MLGRLKTWAASIKLEILMLWVAGRDFRTPFAARAIAFGVVAYALSPIDLIPDFIPVLGLIDDLLLLPLGVILAKRLIPEPLLSEYRQKAATIALPRKSLAGALIVLTIWAAAIVVAKRWFYD